ncbi:ester cyclase [Nocardia sp. R6R-6]|uniref:ester cyclase n=1 Tax=Nocardia sp. R6R-6 TaxID=3459303 RepID=UPI00403E1F43
MPLSDAAKVRMQRETVANHMAGENAHDWDRVWETFIQDERTHYDVIPFAARYEGFTGVQDFYAAFESSFPDFQLAVSHEYDVPGCSIREVTVTATHKGEFAGVAPTGNRVSFELAAFYLFGESDDEAGKLLVERVYFDTETLLRQLRGEEGATGVGLIEDGKVGS